MTINSKQKGNRGEREFAKLCRENGFHETRRGQQYNGLDGEDVVGLPYMHVEVKRVERLSISKAIRQAVEDAKDGQIPMVAHRKNREEWLITMRAKDWFGLYKEFIKNIQMKGG